MAYIVVTDSPTFPAQNPWQPITLTSNINLSWAVSFDSNTVIAAANKVIPDQNGWSITLDDATKGQNGTQLLFYNTTIYNFNLLKNDSTLIVNVLAGQSITLFLSDNSTAAGIWDVIPFGGEFNSISTFEIASSDTSIVVTGGTVNPPGSDVDIKLTPSIANIISLDNTGIAVVTANDPLEWGTTSIVGGTNITVDYGNGVISTPTISLNSEVEGLTSLGVGNFDFTGSNITTVSPDQNINLITTGTGTINLNGLNINGDGEITSVFGISAFVCFNDNITGLSNTIVIEESSNITSVTGGAGTYVINITDSFLSTTYGVFFGFGSSGEPLPPTYQAVWIVRELTSVTISVMNSSGQLVTDLPNSISVMIAGGK